MFLAKKSLWTSITCVILIIIIISTFTNAKATKIKDSNNINMSSKPIICKENSLTLEQQVLIAPLTNISIITNSNTEEVVDTVDSFEEEKKLYEIVDLWNFKPSHNMIVTQALVRVGESKDRFVEWYENETGLSPEYDNWSLQFLLWCVEQSDACEYIPMSHDLENIITFFKEKEQFYINGVAHRPQTGDLLLIDDNDDGLADRICIASFYFSDTATVSTVGGCIWSDELDTYIVQEEEFFIGDNSIVGVCTPSYGLIQDVTFSNPEIIFNGVDTVAYLSKSEYAEFLAENGIDVIARYINPEGRCPLDIAEAQRYSDAGVRIMMIYQINTSDPYKGYDTGYLFGSRALKYARKLQAPKGTPIFFCCDCACDFKNFDKVAQFIMGIKDAMNGEYGVGLYGGYYVNEAMYNLGLIDAYWQSYGFNNGYLSPNLDMFQSSGSTCFFSEIPLPFDSNYVKNPEKVSYIMPTSSEGQPENIINSVQNFIE